MKRLAILSAASALAVTLLAVPGMSQEIVVSSTRSTDVMIEQVNADLDRQLNIASRRDRQLIGAGIAIVRFQCDENGKPDNVALFRRSGDRAVDRTAMRAVSKLSTLHPLPASLEKDQLFQANIVLAQDYVTLDRLSKKLEREEAARIASSPGERTVLALGVTPRPKS